MAPTTGLSAAQVRERERLGLVNVVDDRTSRSLRHILRANFITRFNAILGVLFCVVLATGSYADGLFALVIVINTLLGTIQEWRAKLTLDRVRILHSLSSKVVRDGLCVEVPNDKIVRDDVVLLRAGDQIPIDAVVLESDNMEVNEANLTGESESVAKHPGDTVMSGTHVTAGDAVVVATAVGHDAHVHRLTSETRRFTPDRSEMRGAIDRLLGWTVVVIVVLAPVQLWAQLRVFEVDDWRQASIRTVAGLVGIIPEGLVLLTTLTFLTAAVRLTRHQVLVQRLPAVEMLARVDVVCVDKTGTITTGAMVCSDIDIVCKDPEAPIMEALATLTDDPAANETLRAIAQRCRDHRCLPVTRSVPFDSRRKWKAIETTGHGSWYLGAPEKLLSNSSVLVQVVEERAANGERMLLLARDHCPIDADFDTGRLEPCALIAITEVIRDDAAETISWFVEQGVEVRVLSGDHPNTVRAIARAIGLQDDRVSGRVTPEDKRRIIEDLRSRGHVIAMTGDGVNDVLALKSADIAIAMDNAAPATKAVSELLLMDGKFAHLPAVIAEGRRVIGNVERVAHIFVTKNAMSMFTIISVVALSRAFPFIPRQMTLLSSLTIGIPAFFLAIGAGGGRQRARFLERVLMFSLPVGAVTAAAVVAGSMWLDDSTGTTSTMIAVIAFFWVTISFAAPLTRARFALFWTLMTMAVVAFIVPDARRFFSFEPTLTTSLVAIAISAMACTFVTWWKHRVDSLADPTTSSPQFQPRH